MAETIRGINIQIGSDTTGLSKALKDVNKNARDIKSELRQVERLLKFNPKDTQLLAQKQELLSKQVDNTREKLDRLTAAQSQVNEQFQKGDITEGQYRAFQRELVKTESQLKHFESQLKSSISTSEQFAKKMQETGEKLKAVGDKMSSVGKNLSTKLTAPILGVGAALTGVAIKAGQTTDRVDKMSQKLGISRQAFQELDFILSQNGMSIDTLQTGMKTLSDAAFEASRGTKTYADAFKELEVDVTNSNGELKTQEELLYKSINALQDMEDRTKRTAIATDLFGRSATELAPLLNSGAGSMEALTEMAHELGLVLEDDAIDAGRDFTDTMDQIKRSLGAAATEAGVSLMPAFESLVPVIQEDIVPAVRSLAERVSNLITWYSELPSTSQKAIIALGAFAIGLGPILVGIGAVTSAIGTLLPIIGALATSFAPFLAGGLIVAGIIASANAIIEHRNQVRLLKKDVNDLTKEEMKAHRKWVQNELEKIEALEERMKQQRLASQGTFTEIAMRARVESEAAKARRKELKQRLVELDELIAKEEEIGDAILKNINVSGDYNKAIEELNAMVAQHGDIFKDVLGDNVDISKLTQAELLQLWNDHYKEIMARIEEKTQKEEKEAEKLLKLRTEFEQSWSDRLFQLTADRLEQLEAEKEEALAKAEELGAEKAAILEYYRLKEEEIQNDQAQKELEKEQARINKLKSFQEDWAIKLFQATANNLEILEKEKEKALAKAEELGANKADIITYYALKEQEILDAQAEKESKREQERLRSLENFEQSWSEKLFQQTASRAEILEAEKQAALEIADALGADKTAIIQYYANQQREIEEQALAEKEARAEKERQVIQETAKTWTDSYMEMVDSLVEGSKTIGEVLKEVLINFINMKEKEVLTAHFAELAKAWAQAWWDWSAVGRALAAIAKSTAVFEGAKALVRGLKDGAVIPAGANQLYRLGDGREDEAAIPLNDKVLGAIGKGIAANMPQQQVVAAGSGREIHIHIGTLIADDFGLKKLERRLHSIRVSENLRLGGSRV